jgi:serine/threonine protein kinase
MRALSFTRTIGAGAFGTVYLADFSSGQGFRRQVAVKVLNGDRPQSEMFLSRIRDEARLLGLLQDDAILKVLDMVRVRGRDAVVMEFVEGLDLDSISESGASPSPRALAELGSAVAGGLSRAHQAVHPTTGVPLNVIHRDVKPANIMVTRGGGVKLLDFGVARARFDARESHTGQLVLGTLNYMAPEYIVTGDVSTAADVYGLGLSLWQIAAGKVYGQPKVRQDAHERRLAKRLDEIRGSHGGLVPLLERMLAWDPGVRPTAAQAESLLLDVADDLPGSSLRGWARRVVPEILARRGEAPDSAGLLGQTIELEAAAAPAPDEPAGPAPVADPGDVWDPGGIQDPAEPGPPPPPPIVVDNPRETSHTVSTSRAEPAPTSAPAPPPVPSPRPAPAPAAAPASGGSSSLPVGMIAAGAAGGLVVGLVVVVIAALLLLR